MIAALLLALASCGPKAPAPEPAPVEVAVPVPDVPADAEAAEGVTDPALRALLYEHWEYQMRTIPVWATMLGDRRYDDQLGDPSAAAIWADSVARSEFWNRTYKVDVPGRLSPADALTLEVFRLALEDELATEVCELWKWNVSPRDNPFVDLSYLPELHSLRTITDQTTLLARYRQIPAYVDAMIENLRIGMREGLVANRESVELTVEQIGTELAKPADEWPFVVAANNPTEFPNTADTTFPADVRALVDGEIRAAFGRYHAFLRDELLPVARPPEKAGLQGLPNGKACYAALIKEYTTLHFEPAVLHATGLAELERIHGDMRTVGQRLYGTDDLAAIFARLRSDPSLNYATSDEVITDATAAVDAVRPKLPEFFGHLPKADVVVRPIPDHEAPYTTIAYYRRATPDGSKPGEYFINTYDPTSRPRWQARALAFHEAIPGHHLQIAIAQELPQLPSFRRHDGYTVFVEGWGLYAERLGDEMGLYPTDLDRMGMLAFDSWRAARLVVDTGIHDQGWTREQSVAFMLANTPLAENNIVNEVDRYITTPGQALAYKVGQMLIIGAREDAEQRLGEKFDLRAFHDVVLGAGAVPLTVLTKRVDAWVAQRQAG